MTGTCWTVSLLWKARPGCARKRTGPENYIVILNPKSLSQSASALFLILFGKIAARQKCPFGCLSPPNEKFLSSLPLAFGSFAFWDVAANLGCRYRPGFRVHFYLLPRRGSKISPLSLQLRRLSLDECPRHFS